MQCTRPIRVNNQFFPCGHCLSCRISKAREWSARLLHELSFWPCAVFVTLTYEDSFLPANCSLRKRDLQLFFKRLRKSLGERKIKYYACGEYGSKKNRPHYHAIIFGLGQDKQSKDLIKDTWRYCQWSNFQDSKAFGSVTYDSCRYVSDYIFKKYNGEKAKEEYTDKGLEVPFKISSQGLGLRYCLSDSANLIANNGFSLRGVRMGLPRYYVSKLGLKLEDQSEVKYNQWLHYAEKHNIPLGDVAELKERSNAQREMNVERRASLYHKGEL